MKPKGTATFTCDIVKDTPNFKWFKGDEEIPAEPTDKTEILKEGNKIFLKIKNAGPADVGEYSVEVEGRRYPAKLTLGGEEDYFTIFNQFIDQCSKTSKQTNKKGNLNYYKALPKLDLIIDVFICAF